MVNSVCNNARLQSNLSRCAGKDPVLWVYRCHASAVAIATEILNTQKVPIVLQIDGMIALSAALSDLLLRLCS